MASHFRNENRSKNRIQNEAPVNPNSRAAIRARAEAEEREKREWIAERKRQEKAAAEAEAREKAAWIAERKREEQRREEELKKREKAAKEAERKKRAEKRAEKARVVLRGVKIALLVILSLAVIAGAAGLLLAYKISDSDTNFPNVYINGIPVGGLTKEETEKKLLDSGWNNPDHQILQDFIQFTVIAIDHSMGKTSFSYDILHLNGGYRFLHTHSIGRINNFFSLLFKIFI